VSRERVLVVSSYPPRHCGIGAYAATQVARLREGGADVTVISPPDGEGDVRVPFDGGRPFREAARRGSAFDRIVVHFQPSLYFRPGARAAASKVRTAWGLASLVRRHPRTEVVVHEADPPVWWRPDDVLLRRALRRARVEVHTEAERRALGRAYGVSPSRVRVVDHADGVTVRPPPSRDEARRRLVPDLAPDEVLFLCAGFLHPDKGYDRAVRAFAAAGSPGRLAVVGSVRDATPRNLDSATELRALAGRTPGVTMHEEYVTDQDLDAWVAAADRLVLPYRRSWSSGILVRARLLGTPAFVARVGGLAEQAGTDDRVFDSDAELADLMRDAASATSAGRRPSSAGAGAAP
jgi:glycosyltransferase involved in cell wall biosynthesis